MRRRYERGVRGIERDFEKLRETTRLIRRERLKVELEWRRWRVTT